QGRAEEARKWLGEAIAWLDQSTPEKPRDAGMGVPIPWDRWLEVQLLRHEAEALIRGSPDWNKPEEGIAYARAHVRLRQWKQAVADYDRASRQLPADGWLLKERGRCLVRLGKWQEAVADLAPALEHDPEDALALADLASCYRELKETAKAARDYARVSSLLAN